jgi:[methyl-Co(III) methanol-specific corrinoid protein]:coenzyme M methyltransferase
MMNMAITEVMQQTGSLWPDAHCNSRAMSRLALGVQRLTGADNLGVPFCMTVEAEAMGAEVTMGTVDSEPRVAGYPLSVVAEWPRLREIETGSGRVAVVAEAVNLLAEEAIEAGDLPVVANLTGPVSLATSLVEPMIMFRAMGKEPRAVHDLLAFITDNLISFGRVLLQAGAQVLTVADPSASGEILGPRRFAEFALPYLNRIMDELNSDCQYGLVHICGQLHPIFAEIGDLHTGAMSVDSVTSIAGFRNGVPGKAVVGNVSTHLLLNGQPDQVRAAALHCLRQGAAVLAPACGISPRTPLANLQAMARAAQDFAGTGHEPRTASEPAKITSLYGKWPIDPERLT